MIGRGHHGGKSRKRALLGLQLDRETATLPASVYGALFTIVGGRILLTSIIGQVTTAIQGSAVNIKITATPTTGTAVDIATDLACISDGIGTLYGINAYVGAMVSGEEGAVAMPVNSIIIPVGTLGITTNATRTGSVKWSITYVPYDDNAYVTVA